MRMTIVGLGVLGTSLGLALKAATAEIPVTGHDADAERVSRAKRLGAIDQSHWNLISACREADLIVLDLPFAEIEPTLIALRQDLKEGVVVLDTAPLKVPVLEVMRRVLPEGTAFVGGHVIAPALGLGTQEPSAELLRGAIFLLAVPKDAPAGAAERVADLATAVGATPHFVDALEHDGLVAATAQLPLVGALAMANLIEGAPGGQGHREFVGSELTALGAIIAGEPIHPAETLSANREQLLPRLDALIGELQRVRGLLAGDAQDLAALVTAGRAAAARWSGEGEPGDEMPRLNTVSIWRDLLLGRLGRGVRRPGG